MWGEIGKHLALFLLRISKNQHKITQNISTSYKKTDNHMLPSENRNSLKQTDQPKKYKTLVLILYLF
jgi:hypothetical protein